MRSISRVFIISLIIFFLGFSNASAGFFSDNKFEKEVKIEKIAVKLAREVMRGGYDVITVSELKKWMEQGKKMMIIDAMPLKHYKKKHIPGARQFLFPIESMPVWDKEKTNGKSIEDYENLLGNDKTKPIIVYCGFVKCGRSHNAAYWAKKLGYQNVYRLPGGIYAWEGSSYPLEHGINGNIE